MAFISDHKIYDALPISSDALDNGGLELLRAGVVNEELLVTARCVAFPEPAHWGWVLADIARRLSSLYAGDGRFAEAEVSAAIVAAFTQSFRSSSSRAARAPSRSNPRARKGGKGAVTKSARPRTKVRAKLSVKSKPSTKVVARRKRARAKS
jgi:hypothetical protein